MAQKADRDIKKDYPLPEFVEKLRRLADALERGRRFDIQIAGERISVPARATYNFEHESMAALVTGFEEAALADPLCRGAPKGAHGTDHIRKRSCVVENSA